MIYYALVRPKGCASIFENRELEIKENYNSYTRSRRPRGWRRGWQTLRRRQKAAQEEFLAKRIRAHDGCLGIGRRRRTQKSAISRGELTTSIDPRISEWGNPVRVIPDYSGMNKDSPWEPYVGK